MKDNVDVAAELAAKALVDSGKVFYEDIFIVLPGLKDGEQVVVTIRKVQPVRVTLPMQWRVPVGAGT